MVADNKQPASSKNLQPTVKVGDDSKNNRVGIGLSRIKNNKKLLVTVSLIIILLLGWAIFGLHVGKKVYAQAAGHKIYKQEVQNLIGNTKGVSDHEAAMVLADKYLTEAMAKEQKVSVSSEDIESTYGPAINKQKNINKYSYQLQVNQLYFNKLQAQNQGIYKGQLLVAQFSRNIAVEPLTAEEKAIAPTKGNPAVIARDKKYAQDLIRSLYNQIQSGKITFDQAIQIEHNDPVVGEKQYPSLSHSGSFDTSQQMAALFQPASARQRVSQMKPGQTSKPFVVTVLNTVDPSYIKTFDSYFLVVRMESSSGGNNKVNFTKELMQAKKQMGYKVNV